MYVRVKQSSFLVKVNWTFYAKHHAPVYLYFSLKFWWNWLHKIITVRLLDWKVNTAWSRSVQRKISQLQQNLWKFWTGFHNSIQVSYACAFVIKMNFVKICWFVAIFFLSVIINWTFPCSIWHHFIVNWLIPSVNWYD